MPVAYRFLARGVVGDDGNRKIHLGEAFAVAGDHAWASRRQVRPAIGAHRPPFWQMQHVNILMT
jgi:hypothetical protein